MILVFNKTDVQSHEFAHEWMTDFEAFQIALRKDEDDELRQGGGGSGYMGNLLNSMSLMLEEFYKHLSIVGVSAMAGTGIDDFLEAVKGKVEEYEREYKPELEAMRKKKQEEKVIKQQKELDKLMKDMQVDPAVQTSAGSIGGDSGSVATQAVQVDVLSDFDSDEEGGEMVERDEDEEQSRGEDAEDGEKGLQARYHQALAEDKEKKGAEGGNSMDEESFVRYLMANK